jgi:Domain of unknown function (DUF4271)
LIAIFAAINQTLILKQVFNFIVLLLLPALLFAQKHDTATSIKQDSIIKPVVIARPVPISYDSALHKVLSENIFLNAIGTPVAMQDKIKNQPTDDLLFYVLISIMTVLAVLSFFYFQYFNNLFRVFSNVPLRQGQLTDQLLQAKLPSLLFNILFTITGGIYVYLVFRYYHAAPKLKTVPLMLFCIVLLSIIYLGKFLSLKFTGWLTGYADVTNTYLFVIFLINKIAGILLLPFIIIMAFSDSGLVSGSIVASFIFICLLVLLRFYRSYGLLKNQLKISSLNFLIYIVGLEVVPLLLIYKSLLILLNKNL